MHRELWQALNEWANHHSGGLASKLQTVRRYGTTRPTDSPEDFTDELCWALTEPIVAQRLTSHKNGVDLDSAWIPKLQQNELLSLENPEGLKVPLVSNSLLDGLTLHETTSLLGKWIASRLDSPDALNWAIQQGGVLHRDFRLYIRQHLKHNNEIEMGYRKIWRALASDDYAYLLSARSRRILPSIPDETPGTLRDFIHRLRPIPVFKQQYSYFSEFDNINSNSPTSLCNIDIKLSGLDGMDEIHYYEKRVQDWDGVLSSLADELTSLLKEAMDWLCEFELASEEDDPTNLHLKSIRHYDAHLVAPSWTSLVYLVRDSFSALLRRNPAEAEQLVSRWQYLNYPIFRRLAIYAATVDSDD